MYKRIIFAISILVSNTIYANTLATQWQPQNPNKVNLHHIIYSNKGEIISTSTVFRPDGRAALIIYLQDKNHLYRCIDWKNSDFADISISCDVLIKPKKIDSNLMPFKNMLRNN